MSLSLNQPCGFSLGLCGKGLACIVQPASPNTYPAICMAIDTGASLYTSPPLSQLAAKRAGKKKKTAAPSTTSSTEGYDDAAASVEEVADDGSVTAAADGSDSLSGGETDATDEADDCDAEEEVVAQADPPQTDAHGQSDNETAQDETEETPPPKPKKKVVKKEKSKKSKSTNSSLVTEADTFASMGPSMQGKTTRYWDCCKPSCADPRNAGAVRKPVGTCKKDGKTLAPVADMSGCAGGDAFACNSNQPIAINSTFALGFAAASIQGMAEKDRCCACYRLDFTSGPVQGKTMVVQVTNSGGDLGFNQFDLQIPGGGVGVSFA